MESQPIIDEKDILPKPETAKKLEFPKTYDEAVEWANRVVIALLDENAFAKIPAEVICVSFDNPPGNSDRFHLIRLTKEYLERKCGENEEEYSRLLATTLAGSSENSQPTKPNFNPEDRGRGLRQYLISRYSNNDLKELATGIYPQAVDDMTGMTISSNAQRLIESLEKGNKLEELIKAITPEPTPINNIPPSP